MGIATKSCIQLGQNTTSVITLRQWTALCRGYRRCRTGRIIRARALPLQFAGLLMHAEHLEAVFGVGPHTISVHRIRQADDIDPSTFDNGIDDDVFAKLVACIRVAVPYTGMIIYPRKKCRERVLHLGVSQISGGSRTSVGGYAEPGLDDDSSAQFEVEDRRTLDEVVRWLMELGYIPSFCTACYREDGLGTGS